MATGRQLRDGIPTIKQHYKVDINWRKTLRDREVTVAKDHKEIMARKSTYRKCSPLLPGTKVRVQNQANREWDRTGTVIEALRYRQYTIRLDGSGRLSRRNRVHLKPIHDPKLATPFVQPVPRTSPTSSTTADHPLRRSSRPSKKPDFYCGQVKE